MKRLTVVRLVVVSLILIFSVAAFPTTTRASHSWGGYHWARTANPFTVKLGDNVSSTWDKYLTTASSDWSKSTVLDTTVVNGGTRPKNCRPTSGRVEVCNATYGNTGWLGVAQIWISGSHITQGTTRLNDTYFNTPQYNTPAWRQLVTCQEVGHTFGLDHQDENFNNPNLDTCMDYTNDPSTNQHPNQHDYDELVTIYSHLDSTSTIGASPLTMPNEMANGDFSSPAQWGQLIKASADGRLGTYLHDFGNGNMIITHVFWAE